MPAHPGSADSSGTPWAGRQFEQNEFAGDDGSASPALLDTLGRFRVGEVNASAVVDVLREARLLVPLLAELGESGLGEHGLTIDKSAELSIVTVAGPDGRNVMPVFSSVESMRHWNPGARPVPVDAVRVALAAASEGTDLVVLDPTSATEFVVRRPAVWAIAQQTGWLPSHLDDVVHAEFLRTTEAEESVVDVAVSAGDADARLDGPELVVTLTLAAGLDEAILSALLTRLQERWAASQLIADRVDSLAVRVLPAVPPVEQPG